MDSTPKLLEGKGMGALIFISCIERPKTKREITQDWGLAKDTRQIYQAGVGYEIDQLKQDNLLEEKEDGRLLSVFAGLEKVFEYEAGKETNTEIDQVGASGIKLFIKNWKDFAAFLETPGIRTELLNTKNLLEFYEHNTDNAKKHPIQPFLLLGTAHAIYVGSGKDKARANKLIDLMAPMYTILNTKTFPVYFRKCIGFFSAHDKDSDKASEKLTAISKPLTILFTAMVEAMKKQSQIKD